MTFTPTLTHESKSQPGVTFTVHRIGFGRRTDLDLQTLSLRQRLRELEADYPPPSDQEKQLTEQLEIAKKKSLAVPAAEFEGVIQTDVVPLAAELAAAIPTEVKKQRAVLDEEYGGVDARIRAQWIRAGLVSIAGGELDGMSAEQLLDYGPPMLAQEIYSALVDDGRVRTAESKKTLPSPSTSGEAEGGASPSSTAVAVEASPAAGT